MEEDPRLEGDICGITHVGPQGIEWICARKPHGKIYTRNKSSNRHRKGDFIFSNNPQVDAHYFINRWPNREVG